MRRLRDSSWSYREGKDLEGMSQLRGAESEPDSSMSEAEAPPESNPPQEPEEPSTPADKASERLTQLELMVKKQDEQMHELLDLMKKILEKEPEAAAKGEDTGILGDLKSLLGLVGKDEGSGGSMFEEFYKQSHLAWDKVMIANLKKAAGISTTEHIEVAGH